MSHEVSVRDLRNDTAAVVRRAEAGETLTLTVNRRPVADISPHEPKRGWAPRSVAERIIREHPLDPGFLDDLADVRDGRPLSAGLLDTSVWIALEQGRPLGALPDEFAVSIVTLAELELGVLRARNTPTRAARQATLREIRRDVPALAATDAVAALWAEIAATLSETGARRKVNDVWIAATARDAGVPVFTRDADFDGFPGVEVVRV